MRGSLLVIDYTLALGMIFAELVGHLEWSHKTHSETKIGAGFTCDITSILIANSIAIVFTLAGNCMILDGNGNQLLKENALVESFANFRRLLSFVQ
jgi:hypothetical protein